MPLIAQQNYFMILIGIGHIVNYGIEIFRRKEIDSKGVLDFNGIPRAPIESWLGIVQYFYIAFLIGLIV